MRIAGLLPKGNILMPNEQLQVEWFYMTFHKKSDCMEYVQSGHKVSNKTLQTVAEYFQLIHETCENNGSLTRHQIKKIWAEAKRKLCRKLVERLGCKQCLLSDQHRGYRLYNQSNGGHHCCQHGRCKQRKLHNDGSRGDDKCDVRMSPHEHEDKDFKPYCIHGKHAKHLYKECHANPHNQAKSRANNNKRRHKRRHCSNNRYTSSNDESRKSTHIPMPSNGDVSTSNKSKAEENFYLSEGKKNKKRRSSDVPSSSCSCKSDSTSKKHGTSKKRHTSKKRRNSDINPDWDKTFKDAFVTDVEVADLKNRIQIENPFAFGK